MAILKQSTAYTRAFLMVQSSDHITGITGATVTVTISKAGAAFGAAAGTVTEIANGWYKCAFTTADTGTLGDLAVHCTATSADPTDFCDQVCANILGDTLPANTTQIAGSAVSATTAQLGVNVVNWNNTVVATPATAGIPDINVKNMNNVAATSITTINANQGTTQPLNFTGTAGAALVKSDMQDIAGAAVSTTSAQIGVNVVNINAQTASAAAGVTFPSSIASPTNITAGTITTATNLTNAPTAGDFTATMKTSLNAATPASITGAVASVTGNVGGSVGSVTAAVTVDGTSPLTEAYAAQGAALTLAKALYGINQFLGQHSTSGTTWSIQKRDGSTAAKTYTLDSATAPTKISEAT